MEPETDASRPGTPKPGGLAHASGSRDEMYREPTQLPNVPGVYQHRMCLSCSVLAYYLAIPLKALICKKVF